MAQIDLAQLRRLNLPRVDQLSFIVQDMEAALPAYAAMYNIETWYRTHFVQNTVQRGDNPAMTPTGTYFMAIPASCRLN